MSGHLRAYIELRGHGARGPRYQVRLNKPDGMVLIGATTEPMFDAARALLSKGITGKIELWDMVRPFPRMRGDIERLAGMTVGESQDGIALRRYVERTASGDFEEGPTIGSQAAISRQGGQVAQPSGDAEVSDAYSEMKVGTGADLISARSSARSAAAA